MNLPYIIIIKSIRKEKFMSEKFIMKVGESLVAGGPAGTAAEPDSYR